jgi:hypothetical protein
MSKIREVISKNINAQNFLHGKIMMILSYISRDGPIISTSGATCFIALGSKFTRQTDPVYE